MALSQIFYSINISQIFYIILTQNFLVLTGDDMTINNPTTNNPTTNNPTTNSHVEIDDVDIKDGCLSETLTIGVFQLKSPFHDELTIVGGRGRKTIDVTEETSPAYDRRLKKIDILLKGIKKLNEKDLDNKINIIVFPEYSLSKDIKEKIGTFVNQTNIIVIGNYYDVNDRSSKSFVALPTGWAKKEIYETAKVTISDYDQEVLKDNNTK